MQKQYRTLYANNKFLIQIMIFLCGSYQKGRTDIYMRYNVDRNIDTRSFWKNADLLPIIIQNFYSLWEKNQKKWDNKSYIRRWLREILRCTKIEEMNLVIIQNVDPLRKGGRREIYRSYIESSPYLVLVKVVGCADVYSPIQYVNPLLYQQKWAHIVHYRPELYRSNDAFLFYDSFSFYKENNFH